jgi:hypothetical protein
MPTSAKLKAQITELMQREKLQSSVEKKLKGFNVSSMLFAYKSKKTKYSITVDLINEPLENIRKKIQKVLKAFPPSGNNTIYMSGQDQPTESPFVLRFKNGHYDPYVAQIDYTSKDYWIHINLSVRFYSDDIKGVFIRKVYDSEYHYYIGVPMNKLRKLTKQAYRLDVFENVSFYGGEQVAHTTSKEEAEEFNYVVLNGHTPEFGKFWQDQLEIMSNGKKANLPSVDKMERKAN